MADNHIINKFSFLLKATSCFHSILDINYKQYIMLCNVMHDFAIQDLYLDYDFNIRLWVWVFSQVQVRKVQIRHLNTGRT